MERCRERPLFGRSLRFHGGRCDSARGCWQLSRVEFHQVARQRGGVTIVTPPLVMFLNVAPAADPYDRAVFPSGGHGGGWSDRGLFPMTYCMTVIMPWFLRSGRLPHFRPLHLKL